MYSNYLVERAMRNNKIWDQISGYINNYSSTIDLSDKSITLVCVSDIQLEKSVLSFLNCMGRVKFTKTLFLTSKVDHPYLEKIKKYSKIKRIYPLTSLQEYCKFIVKDLYHHIETDYLLIVQYDGTIVRQDAWTDEFLNYDYIGAPWPEHIIVDRIKYPSLLSKFPENAVGNGGFSLRSYKLMKFIAELPNIDTILKRRSYIEDVLYAGDYETVGLYKDQGIKIAPYDLAGYFSYEFEHKFALRKWFGTHGRYMHISQRFMDSIDENKLMNRIKEIYD